MTTYCNFHVSHTFNRVTHWFFPYCGCGWVGELATSDEFNQADLTGLAMRWEAHRTQFARIARERSGTFGL